VLRNAHPGTPLAATATNDLLARDSKPGPATAVSDGFLSCRRSNAGLLVAYADDRFRNRLALPGLPEIIGAPLVDLLGARLSVEQRNDVLGAVASVRRVTLRLDETGTPLGELTLVLAPTLLDGIWVGALANGAHTHELRIEAAALLPVSSAPPAQATVGRDTGSSLPLVANILDGVRSLIGIRDEAGRYLLVNAAMAELHGVLPSAFLGRTPAQLGLPDHVVIDPRARSEGEPRVAHDVQINDATGRRRRFDVTWRNIPSEDRRGSYLLEVATETLDGDEPFPLRADAQSRLDLVLRIGGLALIDWNIETDELGWSDQLAQLLEVDAHEVPTTASALARFEHSRDKARVQAELHAHLAGNSGEYYCEYRLKSAKGRVRWVIASGRVITRSLEGRPLTYLGTLQDITESLETGQELQRQLERSREAMRVSDDLAREVRQLESEIREVSQREQERIGRDLHDGLGQELTGVSLLLRSLEDAIARDAPQLSARVHSVRDMVEQSIATARALAQGLSPVHLDRDGFAGALEHLAANSDALYGVPVKFARYGNAALPQELSGAEDLYRIAQEAVRNAAGHSGAGEIRLGLAVDDEKLVVTVEDDGHGISTNAGANGGMGLKIMRYRASIVGASLEIGARDGGGTVVRCSLRHVRARSVD